jgi:putative endonuclease
VGVGPFRRATSTTFFEGPRSYPGAFGVCAECRVVHTARTDLSTSSGCPQCKGRCAHRNTASATVAGVAAKDELGRRGELLAAQTLEDKGLIVLSRNWRCAEGEIDIVARDCIGTVVFCEVKTRSGIGYGTPFEALTVAKRKRLRRLAQVWLHEWATSFRTTRFDVIGILWRDGADPIVDHRERVF